MPDYIGAIDQGTTSTRFIVFDHSGRIVASAQKEHEQIYPKPGWVEHDPNEIWRRTQEVIAEAMAQRGLRPADLAAIGITNQRETTVSGIARPDGRSATRSSGRIRGSGDDIAEFSRRRRRRPLPRQDRAAALHLLQQPEDSLDSRHVPGAREQAEAGELLFGTIDTFLVWHLTGGLHLTDCTNASRTQLMNLATLDWDRGAAARFRHPRAMLPRICSQQRSLR